MKHHHLSVPAAAARRLARGLAIPVVCLVLGACVDTRPRAEVEFRYADLTGSVPPQLLTLSFDDGAGLQSAIDRPPRNAQVPSDPSVSALYETRTRGDLTVKLVLARSADTLAAGTIHLPLRPDWRWSVEMFVSSSGSALEHCIQCAGWLTFPVTDPLRTGASDTLYVAWAGSTLSKAVAY
jgi:hypothetical protein